VPPFFKMKPSRKNVMKLTFAGLLLYTVLMLVSEPYSSRSLMSVSDESSSISALDDSKFSWFSEMQEERYLNANSADMNYIIEQNPLDERNLRRSSTFSLDELKLDGKVFCGGFKCFFSSRVDDNVGFLVLHKMKGKEWLLDFNKRIHTMVKEWAEEEREQGYLFRHFYDLDELPLELNLKEREEEKKMLYSRMALNNNYHPSTKVDEILITKVEKAPRSNKVLKCGTDWQPFLEAKVLNKKTSKAFKSNISGELKAAFDFIRRHPCLTSDFQLLLDKEGKVYQIDLDRCLGGVKPQTMSWFERNCVTHYKAKLRDLGLDDTVLDRDELLTVSTK